MKKHISVEQLKELSKEQRERLREWWKPAVGDIVCYKNEEHTIVYCTDGEIKVMPYTDIPFCIINDIEKRSLPLINIGQMIEILRGKDESGFVHFTVFKDINIVDSWYGIMEHDEYEADEIVDALWMAVKAVL